MIKKNRFLFLFPPDFCSVSWKSAIRNAKCEILVGALLFALCLPAQAQEPKKVPRIGYLSASSLSAQSARIEAFREGLRELGYVDGKNIVIELRFGEGKSEPQIAELAVKDRLPAIYDSGGYVEVGGLTSYAASITDLYRRVATYVDKILKGTKPGDLPVEQPTKFEFIINLKAAKQVGLTIPPNVLARADRVIK